MARFCAIAALIGALIGFGLAWYVQAGRIDAANARTDTAIEQKKGVQADLEQCKTAAATQNAAIEAMEQRAKDAQAALKQAEQGRTEAEQRADTILQERTPANVNRCEAARDAFAAELRKERGQ